MPLLYTVAHVRLETLFLHYIIEQSAYRLYLLLYFSEK